MAYRFVEGSAEAFHTRGTEFAFDGTLPFSMATWFNKDALNDTQTLMSFADPGSTTQQINLRLDTTNAVAANAPGGTAFSSTVIPTSGSWHHALGVWATSTSRSAYLNGGGKGTNTDSATSSGMTRIRLGVSADSTPFGFWDGMLAECAIWDVEITDDEALILATGVCPLFVRPENLVLYTPLIRAVRFPIDLMGGLILNDNGTPTVDDHPRIIYPSRRHIITPSVAAIVGNPYYYYASQ